MSILESLKYNSYYNCYTAETVKKTGLPMVGGDMSKAEYSQKYADKWLSATRCKNIKQPVKDDEEPVAFYRVMNGYVPLYERGC